MDKPSCHLTRDQRAYVGMARGGFVGSTLGAYLGWTFADHGVGGENVLAWLTGAGLVIGVTLGALCGMFCWRDAGPRQTAKDLQVHSHS